MPLFDYLCLDCGKTTEVLMTTSTEEACCAGCGSRRVKKMLSAPSSFTGSVRRGMPGAGDTACCGSAPGQAAGCAGPGSCCGKVPT